ncbi:hypothetical protein B7463_g7007, partial [Scytalidium lignicola]
MAVDYDNVGKTVLRPAYLAHIVLRTTDTESFKEMCDFYVKFLNAEITFENNVLCFLTYDQEHHRIAIGIFPETIKRVGKPAGLAHIAFTYNNLPDLAISYRQRKALGIIPFWCVNHGPTTSLYYHDPDGNELETQVDNFDTPEEAAQFFQSKEFEDNPIGVDFNPEELSKGKGVNFNFNHIGISVPDCDFAVKWYSEIFGFRQLRPSVRMNRSEDPNGIIFRIYGEELQEVKVAYLGTGNSVGFEIFEFINPRYNGSASTTTFKGENWISGGFFHIAITAPEPEVLVKEVVNTGGKQIGESVELPNLEKALYVQDPWGNVIEIVSSSFETLLLAQPT